MKEKTSSGRRGGILQPTRRGPHNHSSRERARSCGSVLQQQTQRHCGGFSRASITCRSLLICCSPPSNSDWASPSGGGSDGEAVSEVELNVPLNSVDASCNGAITVLKQSFSGQGQQLIAVASMVTGNNSNSGAGFQRSCSCITPLQGAERCNLVDGPDHDLRMALDSPVEAEPASRTADS